MKQLRIFAVGATLAGGVITLLTMIMVVRERRREIGVMKAIGSSNIKTVGQFMSEALTLTSLGLVVGLLFAVVAATPITNALVSNSQASSQTSSNGQLGGPRPGGFRGFAAAGVTNLQTIETSVGWSTLGYGALAAFAIAAIGSAAPAFLISKVRPSEVMRAE